MANGWWNKTKMYGKMKQVTRNTKKNSRRPLSLHDYTHENTRSCFPGRHQKELNKHIKHKNSWKFWQLANKTH